MMQDRLKIEMFCVTLDCAHPDKLSDFYAEFLGWQKGESEDGFYWAAQDGKYPFLVFQEEPKYTAPIWPSEPYEQIQMEHIDFAVTDLWEAVWKAQKLGAVLAEKEEERDKKQSWIVMLDPEGHPFCLCEKKTIFEQSRKALIIE